MFFLRAAPWGAVCVLLVAPSFAAPQSALSSALHTVWTESPRVQAADAERRAAQARARAAGQPVYNPSIQLEGENADVDRRTVGASLALDLSGKRRARVVEGDADVRAADAAYALVRRDVAIDWLKAWAAVTLVRQQGELGRRRVALMQRFDELAAQRLKVGDIGSPERDLAALALGEAGIEQATLAAQEAAAAGSLEAIDGQADGDIPPMPGGLPPLADAVAPMPVEHRFELVKARAEQARAEAGITVAERARRPDPTVSLTGGQVRSGARSDRVVGVSVSMPLPIRNTGRAEIAAAQADADAAFASGRAVRLRSEAWLRQARLTYSTSRAASEAFRTSRANAFEERARLLEKLWQAGEIGTSDYLVQLKQSLDTALAGLALENQTWQAWFDYLAASGRLGDWIDGPSKDFSP